MPRLTLARKTKPERRRERDRTLDELRVTPNTRNNRYRPAVVAFFSSLDPGHVPRSPLELDHLLGRYLETLYHEGDTIGLAGDTLCGLTHFLPHLRGSLQYSWCLFKAWRKTELPCQAPPFDDLIVSGLAGLALRVGQLPLAASLMLAYHCFLRSGEMFTLRCSDILLSPDLRSGALSLQITKKGIRDSVRITDCLIAKLCHRRIASAETPHEPFIGCTPAQARTSLGLLLDFFNLSSFGFRWYSARRGGATADFRNHGLMERTLIRGRWENSRTARIYITDGISALINLQLTPRQRSDLSQHTALLLRLA